jgi:ribonuclease BN (tRNA processing enzyme)
LVRVGPATAVLVNGVFGDPLLHLRLRHQKRSLLFDLGEAVRLPGRIAHQISDLFITHAHIDHIGGFLWLLRSRIGDLPVCRLFGPPGLAENIAGLVQGIHWDRIGERGPRFEVAELHDGQLERFALQAGRSGAQELAQWPVTDGILLDERAFRVRAVTLDHGTPVLAFAYESCRQVAIRKDRVTALGLATGPWLAELKRSLAAGDPGARIGLPDGRKETAGALALELVRIRPGQKLVYATDLADTAENRYRLTALAQGAHTLFCEAAFAEVHARQAANTGHLTARACGEIATAAAVQRLVPFHLSRRYEKDPGQVYAEVLAACPRAMVPTSTQLSIQDSITE